MFDRQTQGFFTTAREEDSKETVGGQERRKQKRLGSMDMVVFDCEDDEESRPAATGGGAFNFGCLDAVDCILYFLWRLYYFRVRRTCCGSVMTWTLMGRRQSMVYEDRTGSFE